jgi:hypothetical protein
MACFFVAASIAAAQGPDKLPSDSGPVDVTAENFIRAKTALQFDKYLARAGGMNRFGHVRSVAGVDSRSSKRLNRDTLYSVAIVDISQGATVFMPDAGDRYMSLQVANQDMYTNRVFHGGGSYDLILEEFDTQFVWLLVRTLVFESIDGDVEAAHALQDQMRITGASDRTYTHPDYDPASFKATEKLLVELGKGLSSNRKTAGSRETVDPIKHLLAAAYGFGGLPESESFLINVQPNLPSDKAYTLTLRDVPVDGFWSLAMYDKDGYFHENEYGSYGFGDRTAKKNPDGSITLHFGGNPDSVNFVPITDGWNYVVRLYQPRAEILDGTWKFPDVREVCDKD